MMSMYMNVVWMVTMSLFCVGVSEIVSVYTVVAVEWWMLGFLGSWKNCVLANAAVPNAGRTELASWDESDQMHVMCLSPRFHILGPNFTF